MVQPPPSSSSPKFSLILFLFHFPHTPNQEHKIASLPYPAAAATSRPPPRRLVRRWSLSPAAIGDPSRAATPSPLFLRRRRSLRRPSQPPHRQGRLGSAAVSALSVGRRRRSISSRSRRPSRRHRRFAAADVCDKNKLVG
ncbi:hypothetical protein LINPERHAP2_LOCUS39688 [Linum perenne]